MPYPDIEVGDLVTADLLTSLQPLTAIKAVDESVVSSTTNQSDDELALEVEADATYLFTGWIIFNSAVENADLRANFSLPTGATFKREGLGQPNGATNALGVAGVIPDTGVLTTGTNDGRGAISAELGIIYSGFLITDDAGTFRFIWSQVTSQATAVTVKAGSWIRLERIA
jgi:hypothetical protein